MGDFVKDKAGEIKVKARDKVKQKGTETLEKQRKEYDESNFNYAILFLDNSGTFESAEKGNAFSSTLLNISKAAGNEEKTTGERAYTNLKNGELFLAGNKFYMAEKSFLLSKKQYEEDDKAETANYSQVLSNLGLLYQLRGQYNKARGFNDKALTLREKADNHGMLVVSLNNNAVLKKETGYYTEAEQDLLKALKLAGDEDKLSCALIHNNLAMTYVDMNKLKEAESQMGQAIGNAASVLKDNSANYIKLQVNLANIYRFQKKYESAEQLYRKAIAAKEKKLGAHPDLAHLKKGLAQVYLEMGKTAEVESLLLSALDIDKRKLGERNPATVAVKQELGNFYRFSGNNARSLELLKEVLAIKKIIYGESHPSFIQALEDLSLSEWQAGQIIEAKNNYEVVIKSTLDYIRLYFKTLNESEKTLYWEKTGVRLQRFYSFAAENSSNAELLKLMYNTVLNTKGFLLDNSSKIRQVILSGSDEELKSLYRLWLETREMLNMAFQMSAEELKADNVNTDSLKNRSGELERLLSQKSSLFRKDQTTGPLTVESIQQQLKPNEAAIEIIEISSYRNGFTGTEEYGALIVKQGSFKYQALGSGVTINNAIDDFRKKVTALKPENEAYNFTWKEIDAHLTNITRLYIALDGAYHQLSILGLKDPTGVYLADKYTIRLLGNTGDLLGLKETESQALKPQLAILAGNPFYGKNGLVEQLPGTETEVKNITKLLTANRVKAQSVIGPNATEGKIKSVSSPGILHIATHGYFLADVNQVETPRVLGVEISAAKENPLLRSGLLFANCENVFNEDFHPSPNSENGVLTAYEAMALDLEKTQLVVLSACETGLGSVKQGEGVYGLQRAFLIAGAKSIIMSLWSVSDDATMELMTLFYSGYVKSGNKSQAFTDAIKKLKLKYKEPFYWSAFVMLSR